LEDGDSISLQSRGHVLFTAQYNEDNVSLLDKCQAGLLVAHYKRFRFPKLGVNSCEANPLGAQHPHGCSAHRPWALGAWRADMNFKLTLLPVPEK